MVVQWQLQKSPLAKIFIVIMAMMPFLISLLLHPLDLTYLLSLILGLLLSKLLFTESFSFLASKENSLSWNDGIWIFSNKSTTVYGKQHQRSFSLGQVVFLSIKPEKSQTVNLWLFPDSVISYSYGWRHLLSCFHLSK